MPWDPTHATIRHVGRRNDDGARLRRKQSLAREPRERFIVARVLPWAGWAEHNVGGSPQIRKHML